MSDARDEALAAIKSELETFAEGFKANLQEEATTIGQMWLFDSALPSNEQREQAVADIFSLMIEAVDAAATGNTEVFETLERSLSNTVTGMRLRGSRQAYDAWQEGRLAVLRTIAKTVSIAAASL